jgi:nucleotide-binding universal stress UspA family protein
MARKFRAKLMLLHVLESQAEDLEQAERMLSALVSTEDQDDLDLATLVKTGNIENEIHSAIAREGVDIVVMGTHGRGLLGRLFVGSITQALLRNAGIPILTISHAAAPRDFKRILFATDLSEASRQSFDFVLELARTMGSDVVVFHDIAPANLPYGGFEIPDYNVEQDDEDAAKKLADFVKEGNRQGVKVEPVLAHGVVAKEILSAAEENDADIVVLTVQNKGLLERAFFGAAAEEIVRESRIPVLSIPAEAGTSAIEYRSKQLEQRHEAM